MCENIIIYITDMVHDIICTLTSNYLKIAKLEILIHY
jgi:hypothetical protein